MGRSMKISNVQILTQDALLAMRFRLNKHSTALAADHRPAHKQDRDLDETQTQEPSKTTCIRKYDKRLVGAPYWGARTENVGVESCLNVCIAAVISVNRTGAQLQAMVGVSDLCCRNVVKYMFTILSLFRLGAIFAPCSHQAHQNTKCQTGWAVRHTGW